MRKNKIYIIIFIIFLIVGSCIILLFGCSARAGILSLPNALQHENTFAIRNCCNDNVYILKTEKRQDGCTLYRRKADGTLLRYIMNNDMFIIETANDGKWITQNNRLLPASSKELADEITLLLKGKTTSANVLKKYTDFILSYFFTDYKDSSDVIDYDTLFNAIHETALLYKNNVLNNALRFEKKFTNIFTINTIVTFDESIGSDELISILSSVFKTPYKEIIQTTCTEAAGIVTAYKLQITTTVTGSFQKAELYKDNECVFIIEKLK